MKTLFAITHIGQDGLRRLTFANQGRNHYANEAQAQAALDVYKRDLQTKILGEQAETLAVRPVECYDHGDAVGIFFV